jgi:hypothetical protein
MILELMQQRFLSESIGEAGLKIRESIAAAERNDPAMVAMLHARGVTLDDLRNALDHAQRAAAIVATPQEADATFFPRDPVASQMQSVLQRYFLDLA